MSITITDPSVIFPEWYDARCEFETPSRGYLRDVIVQLEGGNRYQVFFYDPVRLGQDLEEEMKLGRPYLAEPNIILLPEVNTDNIKKAVTELWRNGFFQHLKPL